MLRLIEPRREAWSRFSITVFRGNQPWGHLDFRVLASRTRRQYITIVLSHQFVALCYHSPWKLIHCPLTSCYIQPMGGTRRWEERVRQARSGHLFSRLPLDQDPWVGYPLLYGAFFTQLSPLDSWSHPPSLPLQVQVFEGLLATARPRPR